MSVPLMPADRWGERLIRRLGLWSAVAVLVGSTIGSGIFRTPASVAQRIDDVPLFLFAWVLGAIVVLCGALTYSELAAAFPRSGGVYVFVRESFGRLPAFLFSWAELWVIRPGAFGAIGITASAYTLRTLGLSPAAIVAHLGPLDIRAEQLLGAGFILLVGTVNFFGMHRVQGRRARVARVGGILAGTSCPGNFWWDLLTARHRRPVPLPAGDGLDPLGLRRLGRSGLRRW